MAINVRTKGQTGEREICDWLNGIAFTVLQEAGIPYPPKPVFQRNQNQSAVGGSDITNPFNMCIEVKRQETLSIEAWWVQCEKAAREFGGVPILIFRQNGKRKWRIMMRGHVLAYNRQPSRTIRCEIEHDEFAHFAKSWMESMLRETLWDPVAP